MWNVDRYYYLDIHTPDTVDIDIVLRVQLGQFSVNPPRLLLEVGGTST